MYGAFFMNVNSCTLKKKKEEGLYVFKPLSGQTNHYKICISNIYIVAGQFSNILQGNLMFKGKTKENTKVQKENSFFYLNITQRNAKTVSGCKALQITEGLFLREPCAS
jgi:hypothetical protein